MDGKGAVTLMQDFLSELSELSSTISDNEVYHLPRSASAAIGIPSPSKGLLEKLFSDSVPPKGIIGISHRNNLSPPGASAVFKLPFSLAETQRIAKAAKLNGVSVTHFVHTALILAAKHQGNHAQGMNYSTLISKDLRNLCRGPLHTGSGAANLRMAWWPMSVEIDDFWTTVHRIREEYTKIRAREKALLPALAPCLEKLSPQFDKQFFNSIILSSMGDVTSHIQQPYYGFKVRDLWGTILMKNNVVFTHVRTLFREMEIATAYNEGFHDPGQVRSLLGLAKEIMIHTSNMQARL